MTNKPTLRAYVVNDPPKGSNKKPYYHKVGAAWPLKKGGYVLSIPEGLHVGGRILLLKSDEAPPVGSDEELPPEEAQVA